MTFVHLEVFHWNIQAYKHLKAEITKHRPRLPEIIYCQPTVFSQKWVKFISKFGFYFCADCWDEDNYRPIFVNMKKEPNGRLTDPN